MSDNQEKNFESLPIPQGVLGLQSDQALPEVRRVWDKDEQVWYYSILDFIKLVTDAPNPTTYWINFKKRHAKNDEHFREVLKLIKAKVMRAKDGKRRETECVTRQTMLRIVQSIPTKKAEIARLWLAEIGEEKLQEIEQEDQAQILYDDYIRQGRTHSWAEARIRNALGRNTLTDEWVTRGAQQNLHFSALTTTIHKGTFGITPEHHHRDIKKLPKSVKHPRDHYTEAELGVLTLAELAARERHQKNESQGFPELLNDAQVAGEFGEKVRLAFEEASGQPVVSPQNFLDQQKGQGKKQLPIPGQPSLFDDPDSEK